MSENTANSATLLPDFNSVTARRHRNWRHLVDVVTRYVMALGGTFVIIAIVLIAFYLLYVVLPMFRPAHIEKITGYPLPGGVTSSLYYALEEQHEIGLRLTETGELVFFKTADGTPILQKQVFPESGRRITAFGAGDPAQRLLALGTVDGQALLIKHNYTTTYPDDVRMITPGISFPVGETPLQIGDIDHGIKLLAAQSDDDQTTLATLLDDGRIIITGITRESSLLSDEVKFKRVDGAFDTDGTATHMIVDVEQRELYLADTGGYIHYYDISNKSAPRLIQRVLAVPDGVSITSLQFLSGGISILVGDSRGQITQWFPVRDQDNNYTLEHVRDFQSQSAPVTGIAPEYSRKGFIVIDEQGHVGLYHTTAHRTVKLEQIETAALKHVAIAPRANAMLVETAAGQLQYWNVENEHPEISWRSLWGKVWYESRQQPEYIWQSSSAASDFEPKFSLTPLAFGTLKAALYALLFAIPLSILGAIYTAYFMNPRMRAYVKPSIEMMGAFPTVILGFLAGLWLAPYMEKNLPGIFALLLLLPVTIIFAAYGWHRLPASVRLRVPEGWEAALLVPVILLTGVLALTLSQPMEDLFFGGNMPLWLRNEMGITFDQRNSLVVGVAMGFAVIPTIFSISEDAIYGVPKHLTTGSLALGATYWQTMMRVVLLTASPGIFSAIMIGLGRAVGETMIVVMATGNTAVIDMSIFQGFRALSANIAVEMPESEVGSSHYRILFLAALVLFFATFIFNTLAEVVRQRLRVKYSTI